MNKVLRNIYIFKTGGPFIDVSKLGSVETSNRYVLPRNVRSQMQLS